jgi:hypothetical protein
MTVQTINDQTRSKQKSTKTKPKNPSKQQNPPKNRTQTTLKPIKPKTTQTTKNNYLTAPRAHINMSIKPIKNRKDNYSRLMRAKKPKKSYSTLMRAKVLR